ncbi:hypothetical protein [Dickeya fangzhongdai]|uniref:hypothetical protein n=1 Tax=Dickeya fangzhongdai TaxID=1778540 RepID=UPI00068B5274|nr:hypothetical protein [Dickeya fangzhongdai]
MFMQNSCFSRFLSAFFRRHSLLVMLMVGLVLHALVQAAETNTASPLPPAAISLPPMSNPASASGIAVSGQLLPPAQVNPLPYIAVSPLPKTLTYLILAGITLIWVCALGVVTKILRKDQWSLKNALEEEVELPAGTPPPASGIMPLMVASTSRLIALIGTIILGTFFLAIGYYVVWQLCNGQPIQDALDAWSYFLAGTTLFLPYGFNKASSLFK